MALTRKHAERQAAGEAITGPPEQFKVNPKMRAEINEAQERLGVARSALLRLFVREGLAKYRDATELPG